MERVKGIEPSFSFELKNIVFRNHTSLLRAHVGWCADWLTSLRGICKRQSIVDRFGDSKINHLYLRLITGFSNHQNICRFYVPMNHSVLVGMFDSLANLNKQF